MKIWFLILFLVLAHSKAVKADSLQICELYKMKNAELGCDENNYILRFGYKYCRKYLELNDHFSPAGQKILASIRSCLIYRMGHETELNCNNSKQKSEVDHFSCYLHSGFCHMSEVDKWQIFKAAWREFLDPEMLSVAIAVQRVCREQE